MKCKEALIKLLEQPDFDDLCSSISTSLTDEFKGILVDSQFWSRLEAIHGCFSVISRAIHKTEAQECTVSHIFPLVLAVKDDLEVWRFKASTRLAFSDDQTGKIVTALNNRWVGKPNEDTGRAIVALKKDEFLFATLMDPVMCPPVGGAHASFPPLMEAAKVVIDRYYHDSLDKRLRCTLELNHIIAGHGDMGMHYREVQRNFNEYSTEHLPINATALDKIIFKMDFSAKYMDVSSMWDSSVSTPFLKPIGKDLSIISPQGCGVERANKAHKHIHTKARSRLSNAIVKMSVYCYINLRLMNKMGADVNTWLEEEIDDQTLMIVEEQLDGGENKDGEEETGAAGENEADNS